MRFALEETDYFHVMYGSALVPPHAEKHPTLNDTSRSTFVELRQVVEALQAQGVLSDALDARVTSVHIWCTLHGLASLLVSHQLNSLGMRTSGAKALVRQHLDTLLQGLKGR